MLWLSPFPSPPIAARSDADRHACAQPVSSLTVTVQTAWADTGDDLASPFPAMLTPWPRGEAFHAYADAAWAEHLRIQTTSLLQALETSAARVEQTGPGDQKADPCRPDMCHGPAPALAESLTGRKSTALPPIEASRSGAGDLTQRLPMSMCLPLSFEETELPRIPKTTPRCGGAASYL